MVFYLIKKGIDKKTILPEYIYNERYVFITDVQNINKLAQVG